MSEIRRIYDEIMADLKSKGFGGYVEQLNDYKNVGDSTSVTKSAETRHTHLNTPSKNESPAGSILFNGGASSPLTEVIN